MAACWPIGTPRHNAPAVLDGHRARSHTDRMFRGGGGGGAAIGRALVENPLMGLVVVAILVVAIWWWWNYLV